MESNRKIKRPYLASFVLVVSLAVLFFGHGKKFIGLGLNLNDESCLPELHVALLVYTPPEAVLKDMYLFWKPQGSLAYVKQPYVLKKVAAVAGDHLEIKDDQVTVNGKVVASGLENAPLYHTTAAALRKDEIVPAGSIFMIGTAKYSNDSRYWGYLPESAVVGRGYRLF